MSPSLLKRVAAYARSRRRDAAKEPRDRARLEHVRARLAKRG